MLAKRDIVVEGARSGEEALEYLKHKRPDVIFMDVLMPGWMGMRRCILLSATPNLRHTYCHVQLKDNDADRNKAFGG
jgi:CheY-like chemotaxis protein